MIRFTRCSCARCSVFPPHGLDVRGQLLLAASGPGEEHPGRRYLGICASGRRLKAALIRVYAAYLLPAQALYEKYGNAGRSVDDAGRLLQLDAGTGGHAAPGG